MSRGRRSGGPLDSNQNREFLCGGRSVVGSGVKLKRTLGAAKAPYRFCSQIRLLICLQNAVPCERDNICRYSVRSSRQGNWRPSAAPGQRIEQRSLAAVRRADKRDVESFEDHGRRTGRPCSPAPRSTNSLYQGYGAGSCATAVYQRDMLPPSDTFRKVSLPKRSLRCSLHATPQLDL